MQLHCNNKPRTNKALVLAIALVFGMLSGCDTLSSVKIDIHNGKEYSQSGYQYSLPKGLVSYVLTYNPTSKRYILAAHLNPVWTPDGDNTYNIVHNVNPFFEDDIEIKLEENTKFLKFIKSDTKSKLDSILINLAKSATALPSGFLSNDSATGNRLLGTYLFDPTSQGDTDKFARNVRADLNVDLRYRVAECTQADKADAAVANACKRFRKYLNSPRSWLFDIKVAAQVDQSFSKPADCTRGVCYRVKLPVAIRTKFLGNIEVNIYQLPNKSSLYALDVRRAFLNQRIDTINFSQGFLSSVQVDKKSELLEASLLPGEIITGLLAGLAVRAKVITERKEGFEDRERIIKARAALEARKAQSARELAAQAPQLSASTPFIPPVTPSTASEASNPPAVSEIDKDLIAK